MVQWEQTKTRGHSRFQGLRMFITLMRHFPYLSTIYTVFPIPAHHMTVHQCQCGFKFSSQVLIYHPVPVFKPAVPWLEKSVCVGVSWSACECGFESLSLCQFPEPSQITVPLSMCADSSLDSITVMALCDHAAGELVTTTKVMWLISVPQPKTLAVLIPEKCFSTKPILNKHIASTYLLLILHQ